MVERLVSDGAQVRAFARYNSHNDTGMLCSIDPRIYSQLKIVQDDLRDAEAVRNTTKGVDTVFHLGALIAIPYSYVNPPIAKFYVCKRYCQRIHVCSGSGEYGGSRDQPWQ